MCVYVCVCVCVCMCDQYDVHAIYVTLQVCAQVCTFMYRYSCMLCNNSGRNKNLKSLQVVQAHVCVCVCVCVCGVGVFVCAKVQ